MFAIGDKIVYPMHGAGIIEGLIEEEVDGIKHTYYEMMLPVGNLKIKISSLKVEKLGLRQVCDKDQVIQIIQNVKVQPMPENWTQRYKENLEKIKSGNLWEVALVFRNLMYREKQRGLSSAEKKMLTKAKQIIVSEIALSQNVEKCKAEEILASSNMQYN